jgi:hypothetical protein
MKIDKPHMRRLHDGKLRRQSKTGAPRPLVSEANLSSPTMNNVAVPRLPA